MLLLLYLFACIVVNSQQLLTLDRLENDHTSFAWLLFLNTTQTVPDNSSFPLQSTLRLFENVRELGPAHAAHYQIRDVGRGLFSYWSDPGGAVLRFSTSDNTDPRTNSRRYIVCYDSSTCQR
jgi:hypothetical protein